MANDNIAQGFFFLKSFILKFCVIIYGMKAKFKAKIYRVLTMKHISAHYIFSRDLINIK